ncbi:hypothetical protein CISIN_1g035023mg [Citrus sinensis]|uniref:Uncharacterized protein n=1 Tax=Citrus sinensis TaxID=2711 RepID=A0A067ENP3_CITSI|nr:hypothetical protein CISIN_1g035023mg [Citrus sinensis]
MNVRKGSFAHSSSIIHKTLALSKSNSDLFNSGFNTTITSKPTAFLGNLSSIWYSGAIAFKPQQLWNGNSTCQRKV